MKILTEIIKSDMKPALGVTEPGAIAYVVAKAKSYTKGELISVTLSLSSSIYKGAFTCGIPGTTMVGNKFAAALGASGADPKKELQSLENLTGEAFILAQKLIDENRIEVRLNSITSDIYLNAIVKTTSDVCEVTIKHRHTNITLIKLNNDILLSKEEEEKGIVSSSPSSSSRIKSFSLSDILDYVKTVELSEIYFLKEAYDVNLALFEEGLNSKRTTFAKKLFQMNGSVLISDNELATAQLYTNTALEARVIGLSKPAMSITGSGAHGLICTMPLYAICRVRNLPEESLLRATALSYLVTIYIKEYSGILSAYCGCAIAAGTGMGVALCYLSGGSLLQMGYVINNMASSITGMICDGGNAGCTMKGITAVDAAYRAVTLALDNVFIEAVHGINGRSPEETMRNMGLIASPGMVETERTILKIFEDKI